LPDAAVPPAGAAVQCTRCQRVFTAYPAGEPPPLDWPFPGSQSFVAGTRDPLTSVELVGCLHCGARLAIEPHQNGRRVACEGCERSFDAESLAGRHRATMPQSQARALFGSIEAFGGDVRVSQPLRQRPTRAWLERRPGPLSEWIALPLEGTEVWLDAAGLPVTAERATFAFSRDAQGWRHRLREGPTRWDRLHSGARLELVGEVWFGQSGAFEPPTHHAPLDAHPLEPALWQVWADGLLEQGEPLGRWLVNPTRTPLQLQDQLGCLAPLVRRRQAQVVWNDFGFVTELRLLAARFDRHLFITQAEHAPAVRHLVTLTLDLSAPADVPVALSALIRARLPRSLRKVALVGPRAEVGGVAVVLESLAAECPWLETTEDSLWVTPSRG
jgi:hypothetical protein